MLALAASQDDAAGYVIACFGDPGLYALRDQAADRQTAEDDPIQSQMIQQADQIPHMIVYRIGPCRRLR